MHIKTKINLNKYLLLSFSLTGVTLFFSRNFYDVAGILIVYVATITNQLMLVSGSSELVDSVRYDVKRKKLKIVALFIIKLLVLLMGLSLAIHFMGKRVIIPLISYILTIFILIISMKKEST